MEQEKKRAIITNIRRVTDTDSYEISMSLTMSRAEIIDRIPKELCIEIAKEIYKEIQGLTKAEDK